MGADFISVFFYGPEELKIDPGVFKKAVEHATLVVEEAKKAVAIIEKAETENWPKQQLDDRIEKLNLTLLTNREEDSSYSSLIDDDDGSLQNISQLNPEEAVKDLIEVWNNGARDSSIRSVPGREDYKGVVAGEMSWGDEPGGFGYVTLRNALHLQLFKIFGIE